MKYKLNLLFLILYATTIFSCSAQKKESSIPGIVYQSEDLIITRISRHSYEHTSFKQTNDFGNVPCNGLFVVDNEEAIIFDTPTNDKSSQELIGWIKTTLHCKINAVIPTHFHDDCLGGLKAFDESNIPSYAYFKTIALAKDNDFTIPKNSFRDSLVLKAGNESIIAKFFGEGHTKDNVVGYFPADSVLFGGCLVKEAGAGDGYLGDANVTTWSATVEKVKEEYPNVKIVVPGHGAYGDKALLDYTINLFRKR